MADEDDLPPLPPPLPPTHSRSFSSSSSSDAGSPRPVFKGWGGGGGAASTPMRRSDSSSSVSSYSSRRRSGAGMARSGGRTLHEKSASSGSRASSNDSLASPTTARSPGLARTLSASSSRSVNTPSRTMSHTNSGGGTLPRSHNSTASPSPFSFSQRPHASELLAKTSPSLSSHSRFSSSPGGSLATVGLRATPPVSPSLAEDHNLRNFAKNLTSQLPSPPHTASDGGSVAGESARFDTVRSNGTDLTSATGSSGGATGGTNSSAESPTKPQRPPKSEARRGTAQATPPRERSVAGQQVPMIGRTSPTIVGSPAPPGHPRETNDEAESPLTSPRRKALLERGLFAEEGEVEENSSAEFGDVSCASTTPSRENGIVGKPRRRLRARTSSSGANELLSGAGDGEDEAEQRRERRSRKATLLQKNQKILDSINSQLSPFSSTSSLPALADESPPQRLSTIRRSSTSSTIREMAERQASPDEPGADWHQANNGEGSSRERTLRSSTSVDEFGLREEGSTRRGHTLGNPVDGRPGAAHDSPLRSRTQGYRSSTSRLFDDDFPRQFKEDDPSLPLRAMTSMSNYPSSATLDDRRSIRRSDLVGSDRTRAASAYGNTAERDREFAAGMRRLASREVPREKSPQTQALPDSPVHSNQTPGGSIRTRPGLPREFLGSPSPTTSRTPTRSSSRPNLDLDLRADTHPTSPQFVSSASSPLSSRERFRSPRTASPLSTPDPPSSSFSSPTTSRDERRQYSRSEGLDSAALRGQGQRPTLASQKKSSSGSGASGERAVVTPGRRYAGSDASGRDWRTEANSEFMEEPRAYSRLSRDGRMNGHRSRENGSTGTLSPPPAPSSSRYGDNAADIHTRRERLRSMEVGSDAWVAEVEDIRRRARSRQSGSSGGDARSSLDLGATASRAERERDRTVRAINEVLAGQGIVATVVNPTSPTVSSKTSSPRKRQSLVNFDGGSRPRRISFADGTHQDSPSAPGSTLLSRPSSTGSRAGAESSLQGRFADISATSEHHKLLLSAFDRFDQHFSSSSQNDLPESRDLVKRMEALINSTTKINLGLRGLVNQVKDEQIKAQLDEDQLSPTISITQFEKSVNTLLRSSDDQVRDLSEDLIAFTRVERERDRLRREADFSSRPVSRASTYASPGALHSPPKRAATSSPYEGASVSLASARSPTLAREVLRNPLVDPEDSASRRHTLSYGAGRSPFASGNGSASPTPAGRRQSGHVRSPLADDAAAFETPSRRQGSMSSAGVGIETGSPLPPRASSTTTPRRSKGSVCCLLVRFLPGLRLTLSTLQDGSTVRASSPGPSSTIRFPTSAAPEAVTQIDSTHATSNSSPTRASRIPPRPYRTYSEADRYTLEHALEMGANLDELDGTESVHSQLSAHESLSRTASPEVDVSPSPDTSNSGRRPKTRLSTGAIGAALKGVLRSRRGTNDGPPPAEPVSALVRAQTNGTASPRSSFDSSVASSSPDERRVERRKEVEDILRRTASRN
ncbi:hypothetical protein JCM11251_006886 [Rhodosporidiobolus azoricus]